MMSRPVRPGELPVFGSVWKWREHGRPILVLGMTKVSSSWCIAGVSLLDGTVDDNKGIWTRAAYTGIGPVLDGWLCVDEGAP